MTLSKRSLNTVAALALTTMAPATVRDDVPFGTVYCTTNVRQACFRLELNTTAVAAGTQVIARIVNLEGTSQPGVTPIGWARFLELQLLTRVGGSLPGADPIGPLVVTTIGAIEEFGDGPLKWGVIRLEEDPNYVGYSLFTDEELWGADLVGCTVPPNESAPFYRTCGVGGADPGALQFSFTLPGQFQAVDLGLFLSIEDDEGFTGCGINGAQWTHTDVPLCVIPGAEPPEPPSYTVQGFFPPVDNPPSLNLLKAGQAVPVKFTLGGDFGLTVLALGYPTSTVVSCSSSAAIASVEETAAAGGSGLSYDPLSSLYTYVWKTEKGWAGTCRRLVLRFTNGQEKAADFRLAK